MFKRIKNLWNLSKSDIHIVRPNEPIPEDSQQVRLVTQGNGKAEFIGQGTEEEFNDQERKDKFGVKKLFGL